MKARFDELLPFYVNGSLSQADREWVDAYLHDHPKAAAELQWYESLQSRLREDVPAVSSEVGLDRVMQRIQAEGAGRNAPAEHARRAKPPAKHGSGSFIDRLREFFVSITPQPVLRPAFIGALAVVAIQAVVIGNLLGPVEDDATEIRALPPGTVLQKGPFLKVNFKADAREADMRLLLTEVQGSLAGGPGQLGDWYVSVPEKQFAIATQRLKASGIVESVAVVDAMPTRN